MSLVIANVNQTREVRDKKRGERRYFTLPSISLSFVEMGKAASSVFTFAISLLVSSCLNVTFCHPRGRVVFPEEEIESSTIGEITAPDAVLSFYWSFWIVTDYISLLECVFLMLRRSL